MRPLSLDKSPKPVGELMHDLGRISEEDLSAALEYKRQRGIKLGQALVELNLATEADLAEALRTQGKVHCINLTRGVVNPLVASELGAERSRNLGALAINRIAGITTVAMSDPTDVYTVDELALHLGTPVLAVHAEPSKIHACLDDIFAAADHELDVLEDDLEPTEEQEQPVAALVRRLLDSAAAAGASELHLETRAETFVARLRIDGTLCEHLVLPLSWARPTMAHFKLLAQLEVTLHRLPQDGAFQAEVRGRTIDLQFAVTPTLLGEDGVLHLSDLHGPRGLEDLGLEAEDLARVRELVGGGAGLVLVTGPRESGRASTLRALLELARTPSRKLVSIEGADAGPIEGTTQLRTNPRLGLTYASCLQAGLLQDPDVILMGSLEDSACVQAAVQAALDGRLVLARLNARGAAEAVARLLDMGVESHALAEALRGVISQRLVRGVCPDCAEEFTPADEELERLGLRLAAGDRFARAGGCGECRGSGYRGRLGLFEILCVEGATAQLLRWGISTAELHDAAVEGGLVSLADDGARKWRAGRTTLSEVLRVTGGSAR